MQSTLKRILLIASATLLSACADYDFKINDNVIYTPPKPLKNIGVGDDGLRSCIQQTVQDKVISKVEQLTELGCTNAGVKQLAGLERFYKLEVLILNDNSITDLSLLNELSQLTHISFANNDIGSVERLSDLSYLKEVNLSGNDNLNCASTKVLVEVVDKVILPEHCTG